MRLDCSRWFLLFGFWQRLGVLLLPVTGRDTAWLAVAFLLIVAGGYGASGVFRIFDPFLTARLPAEALTITALGCHVVG